MSFIPSDQILAFFLQFTDAIDEENSQLKNVGIYALMLFVFVFLGILLLTLGICINRSEKGRKLYKTLNQKLFFNSFLRSIIQAYVGLVKASVPIFMALYHEHFHKLRQIGIRRLEGEEELPEETMGSEECEEDLSLTTIIIASIQMFTVSMLLLYTICFMGFASTEQLEKDSTRKRCGSLYLDINLKKDGARWMSTIFMTRRIFFVLNLLLLK
mmetsp:Transcript_40575/g.29202  ORF Transcript_40575/g.29202 Transcript_40575/m.29202 type:complete len:214 (+) Transcript_40575:376-1017(+)